MTVETGGPDQSWVAWALGGLLTVGGTAPGPLPAAPAYPVGT